MMPNQEDEWKSTPPGERSISVYEVSKITEIG